MSPYELADKREIEFNKNRVVKIIKEDNSMDMDFGKAIVLLKAGQCLARRGWNGKGMYLELQVPDEHSKMSLPYIYMKTVDDKFVPWLASQTDILAEDYYLVNE